MHLQVMEDAKEAAKEMVVGRAREFLEANGVPLFDILEGAPEDLSVKIQDAVTSMAESMLKKNG